MSFNISSAASLTAQSTSISAFHNADAVALNPQPLPPQEVSSLNKGGSTLFDEYCGTVPRHFPTPHPHWVDNIDATISQQAGLFA